MGTTVTRDATRVTRELWNATQTRSEGATVDALDFPLPHYGYWVGGQSWTLVKAADRVTPDDIAGFVSAHPSARYFGVWVEDDRAYFDVVDLIYREETARETARERHELAVFNISTRETEYTS